jgi:tRNA-binding EMAP/Myf-like protein
LKKLNQLEVDLGTRFFHDYLKPFQLVPADAKFIQFLQLIQHLLKALINVQ